MSDMMLVLRERIDAVKQGLRIGTDVLQSAQDVVGLSNEAMGRALYISEKTWRRWKEAGSVPRSSVGKVATLLKLEIEDAAPQSITLPAGELEALVARMDRHEERLDRILVLLEATQSG